MCKYLILIIIIVTMYIHIYIVGQIISNRPYLENNRAAKKTAAVLHCNCKRYKEVYIFAFSPLLSEIQ